MPTIAPTNTPPIPLAKANSTKLSANAKRRRGCREMMEGEEAVITVRIFGK